jgi:LuxR family maltose regulon positive regulatory protein
VVVPSLVNDLATVGAPLVLVLDDYHLITDAICHQTLGWFLGHLPAEVHVVLSTRLDPPLPLARMRARGELAELRVGEFHFTHEETAELLNGSMGLDLAAEDVARLAERTEGWAAGLVLAGLSLRGRPDPSGFVAAFSGGDRHVADYLVAEVLERQPEELRSSCCGPRCWSGCRVRCATPCSRPKGPPSCCASWRRRTCLWCHWTTAASGTATTSSSPTCCACSLTPASLG